MIFIASCTSPLKAVRKKDGSVVILDRAFFERYQKSGRLRDLPFSIEKNIIRSHYGDSIIFDVPCRRCLNCRMTHAQTWAQRCQVESMTWQDNFFLTLTYEDEYLTYNSDFPTLVKRDVVLFLKQLRDYYDRKYKHQGIRFYLAGEYGDTSLRPHYHIIAFNLPCDDLCYYARSPLGDVYYTSDLISALWGKGHVIIGEATVEAMAYTARYCQKKAVEKIDYLDLDIEPEYVNMSRRPGIALPYFQKNHIEIFSDGHLYLPDGRIIKPFKYYKDKAVEYGYDLSAQKAKDLEQAINAMNLRVDMVSRDYYDQLKDLENEATKKFKTFSRNKC